MKVAIVGSRHFPPEVTAWMQDRVRMFVEGLARKDPTTTIVSGGANGVDSWAAAAAREFGLTLIEIKPDWARYGRAAGIARNSLIVEAADVLIAFWDGRSSGTRDSIEKARLAGKRVRVITYSTDR